MRQSYDDDTVQGRAKGNVVSIYVKTNCLDAKNMEAEVEQHKVTQ